MNAPTPQTSHAEYYFGVLENLNAASKLDLISQLSQSLKASIVDTPSLEPLFGAYKSEETADEIIAAIRARGTFPKN